MCDRHDNYWLLNFPTAFFPSSNSLSIIIERTKSHQYHHRIFHYSDDDASLANKWCLKWPFLLIFYINSRLFYVLRTFIANLWRLIERIILKKINNRSWFYNKMKRSLIQTVLATGDVSHEWVKHLSKLLCKLRNTKCKFP